MRFSSVFLALASTVLVGSQGCGAATTTAPATDGGAAETSSECRNSDASGFATSATGSSAWPASSRAGGADTDAGCAGENCGCGEGPFWLEVEGAPDDPSLQTFSFPGPPFYQLPDLVDAASTEEDAARDTPFYCVATPPGGGGSDPRPKPVCDPAPVTWFAEFIGAINRLALVSACAQPDFNGPCIAIRGQGASSGKSFYRDRTGKLHAFRTTSAGADHAPFASRLRDTHTGSFVGMLEDGRTVSGRFRACLLLGCSIP